MHEFQIKVSEAIVCDHLQSEIDLSNVFIGDCVLQNELSSDIEYVYKDSQSDKTIDIIFDNDKGETNLQAVLGVLTKYDACVVCFGAADLMDAHFLIDTIESEMLSSLPIGVVVYDMNLKVICLRPFTIANNSAIRKTETEWKSYWCWWRDTSQYEVAALLRLSKEFDEVAGDIYTEKVYPKFFDMMISGQTKMWDGKPRNKKYSPASFKAEKQNYKIPMVQLGFWDAATGHITEKGERLLSVIETNGEGSNVYLDCLAKIILLDGKHLDLVKDLEEFQKNCAQIIPETSAEFFVLFDCYMSDKKSLGTRKPTAVKTGAKKAYVRDEPKLWNKLRMLNTQGKARYYVPFVGLAFDWNRINSILLSNAM